MTLLEEKVLSHQIDGARQLAYTNGGILADWMGLGKTFTSILWVEYLNADKVLITAPKEVTSNLKTEVAKWTDRPIIDLRSLTKIKRDTLIEAIASLPRFIILINIEAWSRDKDLLSGLISLQLQCIIVDEAHHINNSRTSAFKGVRELAFAINKCPDCNAVVYPLYKCNRKDCTSGGGLNRFRWCLHCGHQQPLVTVRDCMCGCRLSKALKTARSVFGVLAMTGTPLLNKPADLWPLFHLVDNENFSSAAKYRDDYVQQLGGNRAVFRPGAHELLLKKIGNKFVQRSPKDAGISLPPQTIEVLEYDWDKIKYRKQYDAYKRLEEKFAIELEGELVPITEIVVQITRLRQMITWPMGIEIKDEYGFVTAACNIAQSQKLDIVTDKIREYLECGQRVVAFSHFRAPLRVLERRLGAASVVYDGSTPPSLREAIRADFAAH